MNIGKFDTSNHDLSTLFINKSLEKLANYNFYPEFRANFKVDKKLINQPHQQFDLKDIEQYRSGCAVITVDGIKFNALLFDSNVKKLYVTLTSGNRKQEGGALYTRWSWRNYFDGYFMALDDPMFEFYEDFPKDIMGWFYGTDDNNFMDKAAEIIKSIAKIRGINYSDIILIGSSSGATVSLYLSNKLPGCSVIAYNPQISLIDWPYSKEFVEATNVNLKRDDERNFIRISPDSKSKYFIYYNFVSESDISQMKVLVEFLGLNMAKISYGLNKLADNIHILTSAVNYRDPHTSSPNEYETYVISKFLELGSQSKQKVGQSGFFNYMIEEISSRHELKNSVYRLKASSAKKDKDFLDYAFKNFKSHFCQQKYPDVLDDYRILFELRAFKLPMEYTKNTLTALKELQYTKKQTLEYFQSCSTYNIDTINAIIDCLVSRDFVVNKVYVQFSILIDSLFVDNQIRACYKESFLNICEAFKGVSPEIKIIQNNSLSYAILSDNLINPNYCLPDNLSDNDCIVVSEVCNLIGTKSGYSGFITNKGNSGSLALFALHFFFRNLMGYSGFNSITQLKQTREAFKYAHKSYSPLDYAMQVKNISVILANIISNSDKNSFSELMQLLSSELIELIAIALNLPKHKFVIFKFLNHKAMDNSVDYFNFIPQSAVNNKLHI